jgi:hypothetical protein
MFLLLKCLFVLFFVFFFFFALTELIKFTSHPLACIHLPDSENTSLVDQEPRQDPPLESHAPSLGPQGINIPQTSSFGFPGPSRPSLHHPPPGLPSPYATRNSPSQYKTTSVALPGGSQGMNTLQTTDFNRFVPAHPNPGPISRLPELPNPYAPSLGSRNDHPSSSQTPSGASLHGFQATNIRQSTNYGNPSHSHPGPVSRQSELLGPYTARDSHLRYPTSSNARPHELQGISTPQTTRIDRSGPVHSGPVFPPSGIPSSYAAFDPPSESQSTRGAWPRRTQGTDARWTPIPNHPDSTRPVLPHPPGVLPNSYATRHPPVQYQASSTTLPHGHHAMDIQQISSFDRPGPAYPQPGRTVRNLAPPDLGDIPSNRPDDIRSNRPADIRPNRPGRFRGGAAPQAQVGRHVSRGPNEFETSTRYYLVKGIDTDVEGWTMLGAFEVCST